MPNNKARPLRLAQPLLRFLQEEPLRNRRGHPFKLVGLSYLQFLNAIREIHAKNRNLMHGANVRKSPSPQTVRYRVRLIG